MISFLLNRTNKELVPFPHVAEFALTKCNTIQFDSLPVTSKPTLRLYYVFQGKFNWVLGKQSHILYPGDLAIALPGMLFGGVNNYFNIGTVTWIDIDVAKSPGDHGIFPGTWCNLSSTEKAIIKKIFRLHYKPILNLPAAGNLLQNIRAELVSSEIGHFMRVNQLLNELLILLARTLSRQKNTHRDYPVVFMKLEKSLRENLSHQWTVDEMASLVGLGHTAFSEKVKNFTGFSPLNFLINIRISKAVNLLRRKDFSVTDIALDTGFYSSQHFATTFKKLTGYSPRDFRKTYS
ncbi:helix-turn-helix domain-containing protein [Flavitalea sp.]|nr:AraC family transcriptional regulator [Flavitalea sp.]